MRKLLYISIAFSIVFGSAPFVALGETDAEIQAKIEETRRQREDLLEQQKQLQAAIGALDKQQQSLSGNIKTLDATRKKLLNDLKLTENNIKNSSLTIQKLTSDITKNESTIGNHRAAIEQTLRKLADYDAQSVLFDVLAYETLTEVWTDVGNIKDIQKVLSEEITALEDAQKTLLANKTKKEKEKTKLVNLSSQLNGQKKVVEETQTAKQQLLAATLSQEIEYQKLLEENKKREQEFEAQLFLYESQLKASDISTRPVAGRGAINWPLDSVFITQMFGKTSSSGRLYASGTHNGMDFRATVGTPVKSVRTGIVTATGNTDDQKGCYSYGRWILIKHDNGVSSLYAHLSASVVTAGQAVTTGQVIGYSGGQPRAYGSGFSTGPHLHLGLFVTAGVRVEQYTSSVNCKNVSIPLANPQDYLDPLAYLPAL